MPDIRPYETFEDLEISRDDVEVICNWLFNSCNTLTKDINKVVANKNEDDLDFLQEERTRLEQIIGKLRRAYNIIGIEAL